jgi:hypothetical protein
MGPKASAVPRCSVSKTRMSETECPGVFCACVSRECVSEIVLMTLLRMKCEDEKGRTRLTALPRSVTNLVGVTTLLPVFK